jgi:UDP-glucose 4-epimerase
MRVLVTGATGNVGSALLRALAAEDAVTDVVGLARRRPEHTPPKTTWVQADVGRDDLAPHMVGVDAVVHLAWLIQPSRDPAALEATNVTGSARVFAAAVRAGVRSIVHASSIGTYAHGPKDRAVEEDWPATGIPTSFYSRHKAAAEAILDGLEAAEPDLRIVRLRPALIFQRRAAAEIRRLFAGPFLPGSLLRPGIVPVIPTTARLRTQAVHADDVADAYRRAIVGDVRGAFNIAADDPIDAATVAELLEARTVAVPARVLRAAAAMSWRLRLQPTPPGWVDMGLGSPIMSTRRAKEELGWTPTRSARDALAELLQGLRDGAGGDGPPLDPQAGGPARLGELATGVGARNPGA